MKTVLRFIEEVVSCSVTITTQVSFFDYALIAVYTKVARQIRSLKVTPLYMVTVDCIQKVLKIDLVLTM